MGRHGPVSDDLAAAWVRGLLREVQVLLVGKVTIISLLGRKKEGAKLSEFSYYSFCGGWDTAEERGDKPTFQLWLDHHFEDLGIEVVEYPTFDSKGIPFEEMDAIANRVLQLIVAGHTVVVMDSGGVQRAGSVRKHLNGIQIS